MGRMPMLLKPLSMTLPSRLRTGPLSAATMRRTEASGQLVLLVTVRAADVLGAAGAVVKEVGAEESEPADVAGSQIGPGV